MAKDPNDQFENLFEPFDLEGEPAEAEPQAFPTEESTATGQPIAPQTSESGVAVYCASCGRPNDPANHHCELCGARLPRSSTPVAPQPMLRTTAGARALVVLSAIVLGVALLALVINVFGGDDIVEAEEATTTVATSATLPIGELTPFTSDCTLELSDAFSCEALWDDIDDNRWNATGGGIGAELTFLFSPPVQITEVLFYNVEDDELFHRNARIKAFGIEIDDSVQQTFEELADTNTNPQRIQLRSLRTSSLTITITSAYPGVVFEGKEAFPELALQAIEFFGRTAPDPSSSTTTTP